MIKTSLKTAVVLLAAFAAPLTAQAPWLSGVVEDPSGYPIADATVRVESGARFASLQQTDAEGRFGFAGTAPGSQLEVTVTRIGYRRFSGTLSPPFDTTLTIRLQLAPILVDPIIVSASRVQERTLNAPVSISVVGREQIISRPVTSIADHVRDLQGVDMISAGITQHSIIARGFNNVASGSMLVLTDHRYAGVPSLRINSFYLIPQGNETIERIEVARGPGSAVYGPNTANGVMHFITQSPFDNPGTVVSTGFGERSLRQGSLLHSAAVSRRVGFRVFADYQFARDWSFIDAQERVNRTIAIGRGAFADTLLIGLRDEANEVYHLDGRFDVRIGDAGTMVLSGGTTRALNNIELTEIGSAQVRGWTYSYVQARFNRNRFFAQAFLNASDAGETYLLRTGQPITDDSRLFVVQAQQGAEAGSLGTLTFGVDFKRTVPRTQGTINGANEEDDEFTEIGAYAQSERHITPNLRLVAAGRVDNHSRLDAPIFSPRAALIYEAGRSHTFRLTYNRAFSTPSNNNLFVDLEADSLPFLPYAIRASGVRQGGFTFRRDCGGLCMRSPFNAGGPQEFLPTDGTLVWDGMVQALLQLGVDLTAIPAPSSTDVQSLIAILNPETSRFDPFTEELTDIPELRSKITNALEFGYRGIVGQGFLIETDLWVTRLTNFLGPLRFESPTVLFDEASLRDYLSGFIAPADAAAAAAVLKQIPLGTISPVEAPTPTDLFLTYRNFGTVTLYGADIGLTAFLSRRVIVRGSFSWVSDDFFTQVGGFTDVALNAPRAKGSIAATYRNPDRGFSVGASSRWITGFPVASGVFIGDVDGYALVDIDVSKRLPLGRDVTLSLSARNVLDNRHQEFVGAPSLGRLIVGRLRAAF